MKCFFFLCFEGKTGTDGSGRSTNSEMKGKQQTPFKNFERDYLQNNILKGLHLIKKLKL
jgi:hypothetical protein